MPHRRPSSPPDDEQAANLRRSSSDASRPQRFLAKLKHANLTSSGSTPAPPTALPLPTQPSPGAANPPPGPLAKAASLQPGAQMHRLGTPLPQIQIQNNLLCPHSSLPMSNPTAASASSVSLASTLVGSGMGNPNAASTANVGAGAGSSSNQPLGPGADRDPWHMLHFHVLPLFNGEMLRIPVEDLNELVRKHISNVVARAPARAVTSLEHDVESLLARGMITLNVRVAEVDDAKLIPRLVNTWLLFWHRVLPYVEGIFLPLKTEKPMQSLTKMPKANRPPSPTMQSLTEETTPVTPHPSLHTHSIDIRDLSLCSFRDAIVQPIYIRLIGLFNAGLGQAQGKDKEKEKEKDKEKEKEKEKDPDMMFQRIQQMLLVLLSVSHPPLPLSQSQSSLSTKSPNISPDTNPPSYLLTPTSASRPSFSSGFSTGTASSSGGSALGIVTTPVSATSSTTLPASSSLPSDNALSLLLNALRNPSSAITATTPSGQGNRNAQSRISQPFLISRHSSFLSGSGPRDRRGRIAARKPNNHDRVAPLELDLKSKSEPAVISPTSTVAAGTNRVQFDSDHDGWEDDTPRNAGFGQENAHHSQRTHETRVRSRSDGTLDHDIHENDGDGDEESYGEDGHHGRGYYDQYESYSDDAQGPLSSQVSSKTLIPGIRIYRGGRNTGLSNGMGTIKRARRASASEVDGHVN